MSSPTSGQTGGIKQSPSRARDGRHDGDGDDACISFKSSRNGTLLVALHPAAPALPQEIRPPPPPPPHLTQMTKGDRLVSVLPLARESA